MARVGDELVARQTVQRIRFANDLDAQAAFDRGVSDAVFSAAARTRLSRRRVRDGERSALAWSLVGKIADEAARHTPSEDALGAAGRKLWTHLDRPEGFQTVHLVVLV
ncbi:MAG: peptidylprolyl isomerase, partial [Myxococcota bacterium]